MEKNSRIYVAGHSGLVGSAIIKKLAEYGYNNVVTASSNALDLRDNIAVNNFFMYTKPEYIFLAAGKVGGINASNTRKGESIYDNLMISANVIHNAKVYGTKKLINIGSLCIYPKYIDIPIKEEYLLNGKLEPINESYAIAKITSIKMCSSYNHQYGTNFISLIPSNLYGPNDSYDLSSSYVLPSLIKKFYIAKEERLPEIEIWGTGDAYREFLHTEDFADACVFLINNFDVCQIGEVINVGTGKGTTIKKLVDILKGIFFYKGKIKWNDTMPTGSPYRKLDVSKIRELGWEPKIDLKTGIKTTINDFILRYSEGSLR